MRNKGLLNILFVLLLVTACSNERKHPIDFYYWRAQAKFSDTERMYLDSLQVQKLYLKVFDVDDEGKGACPKAKINEFDSRKQSIEYVPVVFITNRTFEKKQKKDLLQLSTNVFKLIDEICRVNGIAKYFEIQIDCDWTTGTRYNYFYFLECLKQISRKDISSTIRLHQIKYRDKTGIPPVKKGVVMCYATSDPKETTAANSILDFDLLKDYLRGINEYPLEIDIALPIYSWAVVTNHLGKIKIINSVSTQEADTIGDFVKLQHNTYRIKNDMFFHGMYLNKDFSLRIEEISPDLLVKTKRYLAEHVKKDYNILYYHLDEIFLKRYDISTLK